MASKSKISAAIIILLNSSFAWAKMDLPELLAKQAISNIRYISNSGKFTYYQKRSGSLLFSSNYKVTEMLKGQIGTQYEVIGTLARKKIAITQNHNFHSFISIRANETIYLVDYGDTQVKEVGPGTNPQLHANDSWLSYYNFYSRTIYFEHTVNSALKFSIKLNNKINPYFIPKVVMSDENTIYYTDLGENGAPGLLEYKRSSSKSELIFKASGPMVKLEICSHKNNLILGSFGINFSNQGSVITKSSLPISDFKKRESIYNSPANDIGQIVCGLEGDNISFIKNFGTTDSPSYDVADLNLNSKEVKQLSDLKSISSLINMDGTLLILDKGRYLIVKGNADFKNVDALKSLPPSGANEAIKQIDEGADQ